MWAVELGGCCAVVWLASTWTGMRWRERALGAGVFGAALYLQILSWLRGCGGR